MKEREKEREMHFAMLGGHISALIGRRERERKRKEEKEKIEMSKGALCTFVLPPSFPLFRFLRRKNGTIIEFGNLAGSINAPE